MSIKITSGQIIKDVKLLEVDNIRIDNNTISSSNVDGNIILSTNTVVIGSSLSDIEGSLQFGTNNLSEKSITIKSNYETDNGIIIQQTLDPETPWTIEFDAPGSTDANQFPAPWILSLRKPKYDQPNALVMSPVTTKYDIENLKFNQISIDNIKIDNNTISSSGTNSDIILDPIGTGNVKINSGNLILASGSQIYVGDNVFSSEDTLDANITATVAVGALSAGNTLTQGSNITTILKALLQKIYYPTISQPSGSISAVSTYGSATSVEIGTNTTVLLTASFNRGDILGKNNASGVWESGTRQNYTSDGASSYTLDGTNTGATSTKTTSNVIIESSNTWSGTIFYRSGPQPTDSTGANYLSPLSAGSLSRTSSAITGIRAFFYGALSSTNVALANSSQIRSNLTSSINWSSGSPANGQTLALSVPSGTKQVVFAYPDTLRNLTSVIDSSTGYNVVGVFGQYTSPGVLSSTSPYNFGVNGASSYAAINYKVYVYIPSGAISNSSTYTFTI